MERSLLLIPMVTKFPQGINHRAFYGAVNINVFEVGVVRGLKEFIIWKFVLILMKIEEGRVWS